MVIPKGYKKSELGVIPGDWEIRDLEFLSYKITVGIANAATQAYCDSGIVLLRNQNIKPNRLDDTDLVHINFEFAERYKNKMLKEGDLLTVRTGYPGTTCVIPKKYENAQSFTTLITRPKNFLVNSFYLSYYINSEKGIDFFNTSQIGGAQKNVNANTLKTLTILLPKLEEQNSIVEVLADVDSLIVSLEKLIKKKKAIIQGAKQELLTGKKRLPGFCGEWVEKKLDEIGECIIGLTYSPLQIREYGILVLRSSNIYENKLAFEDNVYVCADIPEKLFVKENDLLVCVRNGSRQLIGKCALIGGGLEKSTFGAFMSIFRSEYNQFVYHCFNSNIIKKQVDKVLGATINQITNHDLKNFSLKIPSTLAEQNAITSILSDMDAEIVQLEKRLAKYWLVKQGMMQELLTGRIQLVQSSVQCKVV